jgi:hypothetical protein
LSDDAIAQLLQEHLSISPAAFLTAAQQQPAHASNSSSGSKTAQQRTTKQPRAGGSGTKEGGAAVAGYASVEAFVGVMTKLLDMEREAEVAAAQEATSQCSTTAAQVGAGTACSWVVFEPPVAYMHTWLGCEDAQASQLSCHSTNSGLWLCLSSLM